MAGMLGQEDDRQQYGAAQQNAGNAFASAAPKTAPMQQPAAQMPHPAPSGNAFGLVQPQNPYGAAQQNNYARAPAAPSPNVRAVQNANANAAFMRAPAPPPPAMPAQALMPRAQPGIGRSGAMMGRGPLVPPPPVQRAPAPMLQRAPAPMLQRAPQQANPYAASAANASDYARAAAQPVHPDDQANRMALFSALGRAR